MSPLPAYTSRTLRPHLDVLSIDVRGPAETIFTCMEQVTRHWDGPVHLADTGAGIYNGAYPKRAYMTRDLDAYEALYRSHVEAGLSLPQLIGTSWCGYYETPSSGSGFVDAHTDKPLHERVDIMQRWNIWMEEHHTQLYRQLSQVTP